MGDHVTAHAEVLAELASGYHVSLAVASMRARYPDSPDVPAYTCRYCGKHRAAWFGSKLGGHAKCVVTVDFMLRVLDVLEQHPTLTMAELAAHLDITLATLRAWNTRALDERARHRTENPPAQPA